LQGYNTISSCTTVKSTSGTVKLRHYLYSLMGHKKLIRFKEIKTFSNVLEFPQGMQGKWNDFFKNNNDIILELACGKGEYAVGLGQKFTDKNFIGIDIKGNRLWKGAKTALENGLHNVAFVRTQIDQITTYFGKNEISEIWITFPDPQLRTSKAKKRLTHPKFLRMYQQFLKADGVVHLKTDSPDLYRFTRSVISLYQLELLSDIDDVHSLPLVPEVLQIKTHYEGLDIAQSNRIHYLQFRINKELPMAKDAVLKTLISEQEKV
jgi:tRNA (guanine-N7-)-methyltransferase